MATLRYISGAALAVATLITMLIQGAVTAQSAAPAATQSGASGGSLVYIFGANVWLAAPDGGDAHQLTADGTEQIPYRSPIQGPDGSILVLHGPSELDHLGRDGAPVGNPVTLNTLENGAEGLAISPDGSHLAYVTTGFGQTIDPRFGTPNGTYIYGGTDIAGLDGTSVPGAAIASMLYPSWLDDTTLAGSTGTDLILDTLGGTATTWLTLQDGCIIPDGCPSNTGAAANLSLPVASLDGTHVAYEYVPYYGDGGRRIATVTSFDSAPATECLLPADTAQQLQDTGTLSPDGSAFAWDDTAIDSTTFSVIPGQGVWLLALDRNAADCGASGARLVIPGGSQPDWGPTAP